MDDFSEQQRRTPAYASFLSFTNFLDWLKEMDRMPEQVDQSLWRSKFSGGTGSAIMTSARFLDLLVDERPTPRLHELVQADEVNRKVLIEQMVRSSYGDDIVDRLPGMTPKMLDDHLRDLGATEGIIRKSASFLINALKATNVQVPPAIAKRARNRRTGLKKRTPGQKDISDSEILAKGKEGTPPNLAASEPVHIQRTIRLGDQVEADLRVRGDILKLDNAAEMMSWLQSVIETFDLGEVGEEVTEETTTA